MKLQKTFEENYEGNKKVHLQKIIKEMQDVKKREGDNSNSMPILTDEEGRASVLLKELKFSGVIKDAKIGENNKIDLELNEDYQGAIPFCGDLTSFKGAEDIPHGNEVILDIFENLFEKIKKHNEGKDIKQQIQFPAVPGNHEFKDYCGSRDMKVVEGIFEHNDFSFINLERYLKNNPYDKEEIIPEGEREERKTYIQNKAIKTKMRSLQLIAKIQKYHYEHNEEKDLIDEDFPTLEGFSMDKKSVINELEKEIDKYDFTNNDKFKEYKTYLTSEDEEREEELKKKFDWENSKILPRLIYPYNGKKIRILHHPNFFLTKEQVNEEEVKNINKKTLLTKFQPETDAWGKYKHFPELFENLKIPTIFGHEGACNFNDKNNEKCLCADNKPNLFIANKQDNSIKVERFKGLFFPEPGKDYFCKYNDKDYDVEEGTFLIMNSDAKTNTSDQTESMNKTIEEKNIMQDSEIIKSEDKNNKQSSSEKLKEITINDNNKENKIQSVTLENNLNNLINNQSQEETNKNNEEQKNVKTNTSKEKDAFNTTYDDFKEVIDKANSIQEYRIGEENDPINNGANPYSIMNAVDKDGKKIGVAKSDKLCKQELLNYAMLAACDQRAPVMLGSHKEGKKNNFANLFIQRKFGPVIYNDDNYNYLNDIQRDKEKFHHEDVYDASSTQYANDICFAIFDKDNKHNSLVTPKKNNKNSFDMVSIDNNFFYVLKHKAIFFGKKSECGELFSTGLYKTTYDRLYKFLKNYFSKENDNETEEEKQQILKRIHQKVEKILSFDHERFMKYYLQNCVMCGIDKEMAFKDFEAFMEELYKYWMKMKENMNKDKICIWCIEEQDNKKEIDNPFLNTKTQKAFNDFAEKYKKYEDFNKITQEKFYAKYDEIKELKKKLENGEEVNDKPSEEKIYNKKEYHSSEIEECWIARQPTPLKIFLNIITLGLINLNRLSCCNENSVNVE